MPSAPAAPSSVSTTSMPSPTMTPSIAPSTAQPTSQPSPASAPQPAATPSAAPTGGISVAAMQNAISYAKQNPTSGYAQELQTRIQAGNYNDVLKQMGIDTSKFGTSSAPSAAQTSQNPLEKAGSDILDQAKSGVGEIEQGFQQGQDGSNLANPLEAGLKVGSGIATAITSPLAPVMKPVGDAVNAIADKVSDSPTVQKFAASPAGQITSRVAGDVSDADNIAGAVAGGAEAPDAAAAVADKATTIAEKAQVAKEAPPSPEDQAAAASKAKSAIDNEIRNTAAKYSTVGKVLNKAETVNKTDPISVLASYQDGKALPTITKGKIQTDDAAAFLKSQVSRLSDIKDNLVSSSKKVTPVQDFQARANAIIDAQKGWSLAKKVDMKAQAKSMTEDWKNVYPEGIPNDELDSLKTEHTNESKSYNSKSPFSLDTHAVIGKTARQFVQANAKDAPIDELNKLIQSHYDAIKLVNSMRGKAPHGGALSRMFNNTIGEVGGMAGGIAVGHPFLGAMVGRAGAEAVNDIINNHFISNPLKRSLVNNMKGTDPAVVQKALDYLDASPSTQTDATAPTEDISS